LVTPHAPSTGTEKQSAPSGLARALRTGAVFAAAAAGILPILTQIFVEDGKPFTQPAWASVALGIAAAFVALDRLLGFSSSWMRYISTELLLRKLRDDFRFEWERQRAAWPSSGPSDEQLQRMIAEARDFVSKINRSVHEETTAWVAEFRAALEQLDEDLRSRPAGSEAGGLNVEVTNGDACDDGWTLAVDGGNARTHRGKTAAMAGLTPGLHTVAVEGAMRGKDVRGEAVAAVAPGGIANAQVTLS
jgi:hypothetical protein